MMLIVPESITPEIARFARVLSSDPTPPSVVVVSPIVNATELSCWQNVQNCCQTKGGQPIKGWRIWWIPKILIEAQAHVVWQATDGQLLDITPNEDNERSCVFVRDPSMAEEPGNDFVPSRHENLCGEAFVDDFIRYAGVVSRHQDTIKTTGLWLPDPPELALMQPLLRKIAELRNRLSGSP